MKDYMTESFEDSKLYSNWKKITVKKYFKKFLLFLVATILLILFNYYGYITGEKLSVTIFGIVFAVALIAVTFIFFKDYIKMRKAKLIEAKKVKVVEKYRHSKYHVVKDNDRKGYFLGVLYNGKKEEAVCYEDVFNNVTEGDYVIVFSIENFTELHAVTEK